MDLPGRGFYFVNKHSNGRLEISQDYTPVPLANAKFSRLSGVVGFLTVESPLPEEFKKPFCGVSFHSSKISAIEEFWDKYAACYISREDVRLDIKD